MTRRSVVIDVAVRILYPVMLMASVWILFRGHNEPGGGFVGGMIAVCATTVLAVARGHAHALARMPLGPARLSNCGALLALTSGLAAVLTDRPYLTHLWGTLPPGLDVSTVYAFDIGVYLTVWGALGGLASYAIALDEEPRA